MLKFGVNLLLWAAKFDRETMVLIPKVAEMVLRFRISIRKVLISCILKRHCETRAYIQ